MVDRHVLTIDTKETLLAGRRGEVRDFTIETAATGHIDANRRSNRRQINDWIDRARPGINVATRSAQRGKRIAGNFVAVKLIFRQNAEPLIEVPAAAEGQVVAPGVVAGEADTLATAYIVPDWSGKAATRFESHLTPSALICGVARVGLSILRLGRRRR